MSAKMSVRSPPAWPARRSQNSWATSAKSLRACRNSSVPVISRSCRGEQRLQEAVRIERRLAPGEGVQGHPAHGESGAALIGGQLISMVVRRLPEPGLEQPYKFVAGPAEKCEEVLEDADELQAVDLGAEFFADLAPGRVLRPLAELDLAAQ